MLLGIVLRNSDMITLANASTAVTDIAITNARKIVDARNYIIHGYDSLSADILWSIVVNHLPILEEEIRMLLEE